MRIIELGSLHPHIKMKKIELVKNALSIARHVCGDKHPPPFQPGILLAFFDYEFLEDHSWNEPLGPLDSDTIDESLTRKLMVSWYHPTPGMFLDNFLRMMREEDNRLLVNLAYYFTDLLTGFSPFLRRYKREVGHLAPSLIALGSLAAARQKLGLPETQWTDQVRVLYSDFFIRKLTVFRTSRR